MNARHRLHLPPPPAGLSRRNLFRLGASAAALGALSACGSDDDAAGSATVSIGSQWSDATPKAALAAVLDEYRASSGVSTTVNQFDHESFPQQLNNYLQGKPDDVFTWCAGFRTRFFAEKGLLAPIDDVWEGLSGDLPASIEQQCVGADGKHYFVPFYYYPWAVFYRKSVFDEHGYQVPGTYDDLLDLCKRMTADELTPFAFSDKEGWPAMGTFDILNMRLNGYDFHAALMRGEQSWTGKQVRSVFDTWSELLTHHQPGALGRTWQEAAQTLADGTSGMYLLGMFVAQQIPEDQQDDLDFFVFPEIDPAHGTDSIDAPIDGFLLTEGAADSEPAKKLLSHLAGPQAQDTYLAKDPANVAANSGADVSGYSALQRKAVEVVNATDHIAQFMDRDTRPDFASTALLPAIQSFISDPASISSVLATVEQQRSSMFA